MTVVRRLARPLLAATFVASGVDQLRNARLARDAEPKGRRKK